jgi:hypothetical protein
MATISKKFTQGDALEWKESEASYKASAGWTMYYQLSGPQQINIASTADGDDHKFSIPSTTTKTWASGVYLYQRYAKKADEVHTLERGTLEILLDLTSLDTGSTYDARSHARRMVEALEEVMQGRISKQTESITINGRSILYLSPAELRKEWLHWKAILRQEEEQARIAEGLGARKILVRFDRTS